jgi:competence protein ComEA
VSGAVQQPGLYNLPAESRVGDAIVRAGGMTIVANVDLINQAEKLWDGGQVHIPEIPPVAAEVIAPQPPVGVSGTPAVPTLSPSAVTNSAPGIQINLNTATAAELESLPGIGPSKAEAIIANRPYATVDELDKVPGIGPSTLEQLRPLVSAP